MCVQRAGLFGDDSARCVWSIVLYISIHTTGLILCMTTCTNLYCVHCPAECVQGILPEETVNMYGSPREVLPIASSSKLYAFPSMNFSCSGIITDIRMRMDFRAGLPANRNITQEVIVYFLLFHDGLSSPTRRVSYILLNQTNTQQESPNEIWNNSNPLSLPVTEGIFIGFAIPEYRSPTVYSKNINLSPVQRVEAHIYQLATSFSECEVLEAARTANSSGFNVVELGVPLIVVNFSEWLPVHAHMHSIHTYSMCAHSTLPMFTHAQLFIPVSFPCQALTAAWDCLLLPDLTRPLLRPLSPCRHSWWSLS